MASYRILAPHNHANLLCFCFLPQSCLSIMQIARDLPSFLFFFHVVNYVSFASAAPGQWFTRRDCESLVCPSDWDIAPLINGAVGGVWDWLIQSDTPGVQVDKPTTDTPEPDTELQVWAPPSKECDVVVPDGESQNVSPLRFILLHEADSRGYRDWRILVHAKRA